MTDAALPIDAVLPDLLAALRSAGRVVLQAPPGAGKTTRVPPALLAANLAPGRIVMLEPRRLAARAAAERMAQTLGETAGQTVGYRIRGDAKISAATRIEVVTEGILTRMIQSDPELSGIGAVIFDEFHERSLNADLGLALTLELRAALRPDLLLIVMSATLDAAPVAALMGDAPVVTAEGRAFPVETHWLARPLPADARWETEAARLLLDAVDATEGGVLCFLPGEGEIRRVARLVEGRLPAGCLVQPLFGALSLAEQRAVLSPLPQGRKVVLATSIAETSLTIPDVRVVVDAGRARRARFEPATGLGRLVTERVSRAEAEQRRGRAGRVAPGVCYRLWARAEEGALPAFAPPEIATADLTALALDLALWGASDLPFLTAPPAAALTEARATLRDLGALDARGGITAHGRSLAAMPLHPRLAHMLAVAGRAAAPVAALLSDRDPLRGAPPDLSLRLTALRDPRDYAGRHPWPADRMTLERVRAEAARLSRLAPDRPAPSPGAMAALAYPDRIGLRRPGDAPRWLLSNGRGAAMEPGGPLSAARLIVATDLDGAGREATVRQAASLTESELRDLFPGRIGWEDRVEWSDREGRVVARRQERFGPLVLADRALPDPDPDALARAALDGLRAEGLPWTPAAARLRARAVEGRAAGLPLPPVDDAALMAIAGDWLLPWLVNLRTRADLRGLDLTEALRDHLGRDGVAALDRLWPAHVTTPLGRRLPIDYDADTPGIEARVQEFFGVTEHPAVGPDRRPLRLTLLSPGGKPVAVTTDLPGFWKGGYADVRRDMRGRYPRHPWPDDPTAAEPTTRAKPRGT
ncbi:MAG: ATP-dependent helicase HrpB [Paracoccaceae bacterium]|nr:MAG: ATP-dependent helicase HrpB [Paracoccaceae bacterium]